MQKIKSKYVKDIIAATFPKYRKRYVCIKISNSVELSDLNWSGGTKSEYHACTIDGNQLEEKVDISLPAPWDNPFEGKIINIPENYIIVEGGYFCGHERILTLHVNPQNAKMLEFNEMKLITEKEN